MQFPITDKAAVCFSRGFYGLLAAGCPVDIALTGGRQAIFLDNHRSLEWATPVLFLRGMEGNLFKIGTQPPRKQSVVVELQDEQQDIPQYNDRLIYSLAEFLKISTADLKSTSVEKGRRYKITLPAEVADRLVEAAKSSEFDRRRAVLSIASIQTIW